MSFDQSLEIPRALHHKLLLFDWLFHDLTLSSSLLGRAKERGFVFLKKKKRFRRCLIT